MLCRRIDRHIAVFTWHRQRDMAFEIKVILAAAAYLARNDVLCAGPGRFRVAKHDLRGIVGKLFLLPGFLDRQNRRQFLVGDPNRADRSQCLVVCIRRDGRNRHSRILDNAVSQGRFVLEYRCNIVYAGNVRRRDYPVNARHSSRLASFYRENLCMCMGAKQKRHFLGAGRFRHIVDINRLPADMLDRTVVTDISMNRAANIVAAIHQSFTTSSVSSTSSKSRYNRVIRFPATRRR